MWPTEQTKNYSQVYLKFMQDIDMQKKIINFYKFSWKQLNNN